MNGEDLQFKPLRKFGDSSLNHLRDIRERERAQKSGYYTVSQFRSHYKMEAMCLVTIIVSTIMQSIGTIPPAV